MRAGPQRNEALPAAPDKNLFFGHRVVHITKPSGLSSGRRSKLVAGCCQNYAGRFFRHVGPKMLHRCSKPAEVCTLRRCAIPIPAVSSTSTMRTAAILARALRIFLHTFSSPNLPPCCFTGSAQCPDLCFFVPEFFFSFLISCCNLRMA